MGQIRENDEKRLETRGSNRMKTSRGEMDLRREEKTIVEMGRKEKKPLQRGKGQEKGK